MEDSNFEIIEGTKKNSLVYSCDGYFYTKNCDLKKSIYLQCKNRKMCHGRASIEKSGNDLKDLKITKPHGCDSKWEKVLVHEINYIHYNLCDHFPTQLYFLRPNSNNLEKVTTKIQGKN